MLEINNKYYFTTVESILDKLNIDVHSINNDNFMMCCPFHGERNPSFGIHVETGVYNCFACSARGTILDFVAKILDTNTLIALQFIESLHNNNRAKPTLFKEVAPRQQQYKYQREIGYAAYKYFHSRGITSRTVDMFDISQEGDYVIFPIKNTQGQVLAVQKRHIQTKKFLFPKNFNVKDYVFGLAELIKYGDINKDVVVCESVIDCMTVWEYGGQSIAIYTAMPSQRQIDTLALLPFKRFKDGFDRDDAGRIGWDLFKTVGIPKGIRVIESRDHNKKDINELSYEEYRKWVE